MLRASAGDAITPARLRFRRPPAAASSCWCRAGSRTLLGDARRRDLREGRGPSAPRAGRSTPATSQLLLSDFSPRHLEGAPRDPGRQCGAVSTSGRPMRPPAPTSCRSEEKAQRRAALEELHGEVPALLCRAGLRSDDRRDPGAQGARLGRPAGGPAGRAAALVRPLPAGPGVGPGQGPDGDRRPLHVAGAVRRGRRARDAGGRRRHWRTSHSPRP